jgi:hypothetical protein
MYLAIIFLIVGLVIAYLNANEEWPFGWGTFIGDIVITAVLYFVTLGFIYIFSECSLKNCSYEYKDQPIESLINKSGVSSNGSFILGCGSISGESYDYYVSYADFPQGSLRIKVNAYHAYVKETDSETPKIKNYWIKVTHKGYKSNWIWNKKTRVGEWKTNTYNDAADIIVIVPKHTIYKEFQIKD